MKYRYEIEDERVNKVLSILGEEVVQRFIEHQMEHGNDPFIIINYYLTQGVKIHLDINKNEVKKVLIYDPNDWNPFPKIKPEKNTLYLVQRKSWEEGKEDFYDLFLWEGVDGEDDKDWTNLSVQAFRELPPLIGPKELEND